MAESSSPDCSSELRHSEVNGSRANGQPVYVGSEIHRRMSEAAVGSLPPLRPLYGGGKVWLSVVPLTTVWKTRHKL